MIIINGMYLLIAVVSIMASIKCIKEKEWCGVIYFLMLAIIVICQVVHNYYLNV